VLEKRVDLAAEDAIIGLVAELDEKERELRRREDEVLALRFRLSNEVDRSEQVRVELAELKASVSGNNDLDREVVRLRRELSAIRSSRSWRLGRSLTSPLRILRKVLRRVKSILWTRAKN
jgi:hypothetical protein